MDESERARADAGGTEEAASFYAAYGDFERDVLAQIRRETYGEDIGQFSWLTADELRRFMRQLALEPGGQLLDVACGSGGPALFIAEEAGCAVTGIDISEQGITAGSQTARARGLHERVHFAHLDASRPLPFGAASFDAIISIDAMNHLANRAEVLAEWARLLRPGGRFLFTDAVIVTGMLARDEILARSSAMGQFLFTPAGLHERLIQAAGFVDLHVEDVTATIAAISEAWRRARDRYREYLLETEGAAGFESMQQMLTAAHTLASERRLSRFAYSARTPPAG